MDHLSDKVEELSLVQSPVERSSGRRSSVSNQNRRSEILFPSSSGRHTSSMLGNNTGPAVAFSRNQDSIARALAEPSTVCCTHLNGREGSWLKNDEWTGPYALRVMRCQSTHANVQVQKFVYCERCFDSLGAQKVLAVHQCHSCGHNFPLSALRQHQANPTTEEMLTLGAIQTHESTGQAKLCVFCLAAKNKQTADGLMREESSAYSVGGTRHKVVGAKVRLPPAGINTTPASAFRSPHDIPSITASGKVNSVKWDRVGQRTYNVQDECRTATDRRLDGMERNYSEKPDWETFNSGPL